MSIYPTRSKSSLAQLFHHPSSSSLDDEKVERDLTTMAVAPVRTKSLVFDMKETDKRYELAVDFPGMKKEDISIKTDGNILTISGERKFIEDKEDEKFHRIERYYGHTRRSISLPPNVVSENITAVYDQVNYTMYIAVLFE